ncbi:hypothetical protein [Paracoccus aminovorans]|uniref:hypothetical protein n=1 Tax=Paracoccus aminovorans TaxID=34004 RepID=UPI002B25D859|nr:hypothetical protein [Paracoccus aminovorans]
MPRTAPQPGDRVAQCSAVLRPSGGAEGRPVAQNSAAEPMRPEVRAEIYGLPMQVLRENGEAVAVPA